MREYNVTILITEDLEKFVEVRVKSNSMSEAKEKAYNIVHNRYVNEEIILDANDFTGANIEPFNIEEI